MDKQEVIKYIEEASDFIEKICGRNDDSIPHIKGLQLACNYIKEMNENGK